MEQINTQPFLLLQDGLREVQRVQYENLTLMKLDVHSYFCDLMRLAQEQQNRDNRKTSHRK